MPAEERYNLSIKFQVDTILNSKNRYIYIKKFGYEN
jgi:hypothetical protein